MLLGKVSDTYSAYQTTDMNETIRAGQSENDMTTAEVERILSVGQLLLSVLTPEELDTFRLLLQGQQSSQNDKSKIGNASVS